MKLKKLFKNIETVVFPSEQNPEVFSIAYDSRKVNQNDLFVAIKGYKSDGHKYIEQAVNRKAAAIVYQDNNEFVEKYKDKVSFIKVKDSRKALAQISNQFYENPSEKLITIGITGTNGKTTSTYLIKSVLEANNIDTGLIGTLNYIIGSKKYSAPNTTPESLDLQRYLSEMLECRSKAVVMEVTSHAAFLKRIHDISFDIGIFTNLTQDHLDFHKDFDEYLKAKFSFFENMYNNGKTPMGIINIDDKYGSYFIENLNIPVLTYGISNSADISISNYKLHQNGCSFTIKHPKGLIDIESRLKGKFNLYNILTSFAVGYHLNLDLGKVKLGIESISNINGRFESVNCGQDFSVLVDYAHTPDALERIITTAREFTTNKIIIVFGCGGDRDKTKRSIMGSIASRLSDICIVTSDNPRTENPTNIINDILAGIDNDKSYIIEPDRRSAIEMALKTAKKDDTVIIAGKGHEDYQIIGENRIHFDDKEEVRNILC